MKIVMTVNRVSANAQMDVLKFAKNPKSSKLFRIIIAVRNEYTSRILGLDVSSLLDSNGNTHC